MKRQVNNSVFKKVSQRALISVLLVGMTNMVFALNIIPSNSQGYYAFDGGSDISMPPVTEQKNITIGGDANTNLNFTCDGYNPAISITNTFNNLGSSVEGLGGDVISSATAAIGSSAMYLLEKADPELYNLVQNTMTNAQERFHLSMKSCQDALTQINKGESPYENWFNVSDSQGWLDSSKAAKQGQSVDINHTTKQIAKNPKQYGIPWVHKGQNSGGSVGNQVPIKVIYDVVVAGYNTLIDSSRPLDAQYAAPSTSQLARYWKTPKAAGKWAQLVLGDITISSKSSESTHPGVGLTTILQTCPVSATNNLTCAHGIQQKMVQLVSNSGYPTAKELVAVSSNEMMVTPKLIASIRNMTKSNQAIAISKLSSDVAIQNLVDEALMMRRVLISGSQTKPVHNLKPALTTVNNTISQLNKDIQNVMFEHNIRQQLVMNTAQTILGMENADKARALTEHNETQAPSMENGAVYKSDSE